MRSGDRPLTALERYDPPAHLSHLYLLGVLGVLGLAMGLYSRDLVVSGFFLIGWVAPVIGTAFWRRRFVRTLEVGNSGETLIELYSNKRLAVLQRDVTSAEFKRLGRLRYCVVRTRTSGKVRLVLRNGMPALLERVCVLAETSSSS